MYSSYNIITLYKTHKSSLSPSFSIISIFFTTHTILYPPWHISHTQFHPYHPLSPSSIIIQPFLFFQVFQIERITIISQITAVFSKESLFFISIHFFPFFLQLFLFVYFSISYFLIFYKYNRMLVKLELLFLVIFINLGISLSFLFSWLF